MDTLVLGTFGALSLTAIAVQKFVSRDSGSPGKEDQQDEKDQGYRKFKALQWKFFGAYFLAILGK